MEKSQALIISNCAAQSLTYCTQRFLVQYFVNLQLEHLFNSWDLIWHPKHSGTSFLLIKSASFKSLLANIPRSDIDSFKMIAEFGFPITIFPLFVFNKFQKLYYRLFEKKNSIKPFSSSTWAYNIAIVWPISKSENLKVLSPSNNKL